MSEAPVNALTQALTGETNLENAMRVWAEMSPDARYDAYIKARDAWCMRFGWSPFHIDAPDRRVMREALPGKKRKIGKSHRDMR